MTNWLMSLLAWFGVGSADAIAKPPPPLRICTAWTDRVIPFIENGALNCTDGPLYLTGFPSAIAVDGAVIQAAPGGTLTFSYLTGSGNSIACLDKDGKLYRGNPGC